MKNQIKKTLPKSMWENVVVEENGESLHEVVESDRIKTGLVLKGYKPLLFVRKTIVDKLVRVSNSLPENINLVLIEGFRTMEAQKQSWDDEIKKLRLENPDWDNEKVERKVGLVVARPSVLANHHCGGAVDVTLAYKNGNLVDMGTPYITRSMSVEWHKKFQMLSNDITEEQKSNRKILRDAMESEDFVWYPGEWWHYCWGDRMWAVYSNQSKCFYGPADKFLP